jgi:nitroreductase
MDGIKAIITRRSIRKYKKKVISEKIIKKLIEIGMSAPSAGNEQPWHYIIIDNSEILNKITEFHPHSKMLKEAECAILICFDKELEKHKGMAVQDCSASTQNIMIAANAYGIGTVWLGIYPRIQRLKGMKILLNLPNNIIPFSIISLGYPAEKKPSEKRYKLKRIHFNQWTN